MFTGLASTLLELAARLQAASMVVPVAQLSLISWLMFAVSASLTQGTVQLN